jgi:hypothetical protein
MCRGTDGKEMEMDEEDKEAFFPVFRGSVFLHFLSSSSASFLANLI